MRNINKNQMKILVLKTMIAKKISVPNGLSRSETKK